MGQQSKIRLRRRIRTEVAGFSPDRHHGRSPPWSEIPNRREAHAGQPSYTFDAVAPNVGRERLRSGFLGRIRCTGASLPWFACTPSANDRRRLRDRTGATAVRKLRERRLVRLQHRRWAYLLYLRQEGPRQSGSDAKDSTPNHLQEPGAFETPTRPTQHLDYPDDNAQQRERTPTYSKGAGRTSRWRLLSQTTRTRPAAVAGPTCNRGREADDPIRPLRDKRTNRRITLEAKDGERTRHSLGRAGRSFTP